MKRPRYIHCLPPETAHRLGLWALRRRLLPPAPAFRSPLLELRALGLTFSHPVGLAAGFDKNAEAVSPLLAQGFSFVEAGTTTPLPQPGNPRPRVFRLAEDDAVINRLGFNNDGLARFVENFRRRDPRLGIAGANIGRNKDAADAVADYVTGLRAVSPFADYVTVNISSPNTPGLRALQRREALTELLAALRHARHGSPVPLLLKVAPDLTGQDMEDIAEATMVHGIDGLIVGNTTVSRPEHLRSPHRLETGGLSGRPLFSLSTAALRRFYALTGGRLTLIGVGGVASAEDAYRKIRAGATLVQLYTALVYQGFGLMRKIPAGLAELLTRDGFTHVQQAIGVDAGLP